MDDRTANGALVFAHIAFLAGCLYLLWSFMRRVSGPRQVAPVFRLVPATADEPEDDDAPEPAPAPKKKGH